MSKNVQVNGMVYSGVSQIQLNTTDGVTALFKDVDEVTTSGGVETGTFVGDGTINVTIPVTSQKTGVEIWIDNYDEDNSTFEQYQIVYYTATTGMPQAQMSHMYNGKATTKIKLGAEITTQMPLFTADSIVISNVVSYAQENFASGKTYHWQAW